MIVHVDTDARLPKKQRGSPYNPINWTVVRCTKDTPVTEAQIEALRTLTLDVAIVHDAYQIQVKPSRYSFTCACGAQFSYSMYDTHTMNTHDAAYQHLELV